MYPETSDFEFNLFRTPLRGLLRGTLTKAIPGFCPPGALRASQFAPGELVFVRTKKVPKDDVQDAQILRRPCMAESSEVAPDC